MCPFSEVEVLSGPGNRDQYATARASPRTRGAQSRGERGIVEHARDRVGEAVDVVERRDRGRVADNLAQRGPSSRHYWRAARETLERGRDFFKNRLIIPIRDGLSLARLSSA